MYRHQEHYPHNQSVKSVFNDFRRIKLSGALTALYSNRIIQQIAAGLIGIFFPILLYTKFNYSLYKVVLYFFILNFIWMIIVPLGAKTMSKIGIKKSLIVSVFIGWAWYYFIRKFSMDGALIFLSIALLADVLTAFFYWVPYHTDFAEFSDKRTRGKQLAFLAAIASVVSIIIPFVSGSLIQNYGYGILFLFALLVYLISIVPLFLLPDLRENYSFGYFQTFKEVFKKKNRRMLFSYAADGMQDTVGSVVWPIFIWLLLNKEFVAVGAISSIIIFVSLIVQLLMGDLADRFDKKRVLRWGTALDAVAWCVKMFVGTGFQIFVASTFHSFANIIMRTPFDALMYERAADSGHYVDEYTVVREIALNVGRLLMLGLIALTFFLSGSFVFSFLIAGLAALVIGFI